METTIVLGYYITRLCRGLYGGYLRIMDKNMETTGIIGTL